MRNLTILNTQDDADQWATHFDLDPEEEKILAAWIWENKPHNCCCFRDHPVSDINDADFYNIFEGER